LPRSRRSHSRDRYYWRIIPNIEWLSPSPPPAFGPGPALPRKHPRRGKEFQATSCRNHVLIECNSCGVPWPAEPGSPLSAFRRCSRWSEPSLSADQDALVHWGLRKLRGERRLAPPGIGNMLRDPVARTLCRVTLRSCLRVLTFHLSAAICRGPTLPFLPGGH
jgi:hypothetical protein